MALETPDGHPGMDFSQCYEDTVSGTAAAARAGHRKRLRRLILEGRSVRCADNRGWTALHEAAHAGRAGCLKEILSAAAATAGSRSGFRAYVNSAAHGGESACFLAAGRGHLDVVRLLLKARADIDQLTNNLSCPLYAAVSNGHKDVVQLLVAKGAKLNESHTASCWTCLHQAVYQDHVDIVRILAQSADLEARDDYKMTPLFVAAQYGRRDCLEVLVRAGANVNTQASDLASPLLLASQEGHLSCVDLLLEHGADADLRCSPDWPQLAIHAAAQFGHLGILDRLAGATNRRCDRHPDAVSPLYLAVQGGRTAGVELLLARGFSPDAQDADPVLGVRSPLTLALHNRNSEAARMLLAAGATLRQDEWSLVFDRDRADWLKMVLEHRWLYPPRHRSDRRRKTALRPPELDDLLAAALERPETAGDWLPPLLRAGLEARSLLRSGLLRKADGGVLNFLLQFVNWSTVAPPVKAVLCQRRAERMWRPLPQFGSAPVTRWPYFQLYCADIQYRKRILLIILVAVQVGGVSSQRSCVERLALTKVVFSLKEASRADQRPNPSVFTNGHYDENYSVVQILQALQLVSFTCLCYLIWKYLLLILKAVRFIFIPHLYKFGSK